MYCEMCFRGFYHEEAKIIPVYNYYFGITDNLWACPECVDKHERKEKESKTLLTPDEDSV